jgi:dTDP-4-amino-4,6-dideoxygalactose transaminase
MEHILSERKKVVNLYDKTLDFSRLQKLKIRENTAWNYSYYPVIFESEEKLLQKQKLNENDIYPRRYFYPSLHTYLT